jgi:hypothetical protein
MWLVVEIPAPAPFGCLLQPLLLSCVLDVGIDKDNVRSLSVAIAGASLGP